MSRANVCVEDNNSRDMDKLIPKIGDGHGPALGICYGRKWRELVPEDLGRTNLGRRYTSLVMKRRLVLDVSGKPVRNERGEEQLEPYDEFLTRQLGIVQDESVREIVHKYLARIFEMIRTGTGMKLGGSPGVGKTGIAAIIGMVAVRWGYSVYFVTHTELQELRFQKGFEQDLVDGAPVMERIRKVDLLVLDDFNEDFVGDGKFGPKDLAKLITRRNADGKSTIFTTRITGEQFADPKLSLRNLYDVMKETMPGILVEGRDLREDLGKQAMKRIFGEDKG